MDEWRDGTEIMKSGEFNLDFSCSIWVAGWTSPYNYVGVSFFQQDNPPYHRGWILSNSFNNLTVTSLNLNVASRYHISVLLRNVGVWWGGTIPLWMLSWHICNNCLIAPCCSGLTSVECLRHLAYIVDIYKLGFGQCTSNLVTTRCTSQCDVSVYLVWEPEES